MGSEYDCVIIPVLRANMRLLNRTLIYTAITRAKKKVFLVGQKDMLFAAILRHKADQRNTLLGERIQLYYLQVKFGEAQLSACDSLENGVIHLYNQILSKVNAEFDLRLEESDIDAILERKGGFEPVIADLVERQAASFVGDLFGTLRERGLDLRTGLTIFTGGGAILLRRFIENTGKVGRSLFVTDINANARGFEQLYQSTAQGA